MLPNTDTLNEIIAVAITGEIKQPNLEFLYRQVTQAETTTPQALDTTPSIPGLSISDRAMVTLEQDEPSEYLIPYDPNLILPTPQAAISPHATFDHSYAQKGSIDSAPTSSNNFPVQTSDANPTPSCSYTVAELTNTPSETISDCDESDATTGESPSRDKMRCRLCGFEGQTRRRYRYHLAQSHSVGLNYQPILKKQYQCKICHYTTNRSDSIHRHKRQHMTQAQREQLMKHHCPLCDYKCFRTDHLKNHIKRHYK